MTVTESDPPDPDVVAPEIVHAKSELPVLNVIDADRVIIISEDLAVKNATVRRRTAIVMH